MPTELNAIVLERIEVSPRLIILRVVADGWELPEYNVGQFAVLGLPGEAPKCELAMPEQAVLAIHQHVRPDFPKVRDPKWEPLDE